MLNEKPSEKDYKNIEEKFNEIREVYYGGGMPESIISTDVKIWFLNAYIKIASFLRRFKRNK